MVPSCWPTFALFVVCCPRPETVAPDQVHCPIDAHLVDECCRPDVFERLLAQLGTLSQGEIARSMPEDDYRFVIFELREQLFRYLRDVALLDVQAWRLLSLASLRYSLAEADFIKERAVQERGAEAFRAVWRDALRVTRELGRALFRAENFQQFLLGHTAHLRDEFGAGFSPEEVRASYSSVLDTYIDGVQVHDLLAYNIIPQLEKHFMPSQPPIASETRINLLVVSLGRWAKTGFITLWTALQRSSLRIRVFVFGDAEGIEGWRLAVEELRSGSEEGVRMLSRADFDYVDFAEHPNFKAVLRRYPKGCTFGDAGTAIFARVICHEVLPKDVDRVIAMDLGDILVLDDLRELWDLGDEMEDHHFLAAPHAVALHHINGGLVLYNVRRMREGNFSDIAVRAARDELTAAAARGNWDRLCLRDQSIINVLHSFREVYGYPGPSPVMVLPCRWSVFPTTEWQPYWNQPSNWLPEIVERRRYPGIISKNRVEVYCPDTLDMLGAWAFVPMTETSQTGETRQSRLRLWTYHEGRKNERYCSQERAPDSRCCKCGESAALLHIAGDMKFWPAMQNLLRAHSPPWSVQPDEGALLGAASRGWWGGDARMRSMAEGSMARAYLVAKIGGFNARFDRCATIRTNADSPGQIMYHKMDLAPKLPVELTIETTAARDAFMLLGIEGHSGLEFVFGHDGGTVVQLRIIRSKPGWAARGDLMQFPIPQQFTRRRLGEENDGEDWASFGLKISERQEMQFDFGLGNNGYSFNSFLPEQVFYMLRHVPLTVSVASQGAPAKWGICVGPPL